MAKSWQKSMELPSNLPQKAEANFYRFFTNLSFVAESWHIVFLKTRSLAKSNATKFRFETFREFKTYGSRNSAKTRVTRIRFEYFIKQKNRKCWWNKRSSFRIKSLVN